MKSRRKHLTYTAIAVTGSCFFVPAALAQVETCEVAAIFGEIDEELCVGAETSRQPVICANELKRQNKTAEISATCQGTRNARLSIKCSSYIKNGGRGMGPSSKCGRVFSDPKFEPRIYDKTNPATSSDIPVAYKRLRMCLG